MRSTVTTWVDRATRNISILVDLKTELGAFKKPIDPVAYVRPAQA